MNGKRVNIPSYQCARATWSRSRAKAKEQLRIKAAAEARRAARLPDGSRSTPKSFKGTFKPCPTRADLPPRSTNSWWSSFTRSNP